MGKRGDDGAVGGEGLGRQWFWAEEGGHGRFLEGFDHAGQAGRVPMQCGHRVRCGLLKFAGPNVLGIGRCKSGFSTFSKALKNQAIGRKAKPGGDFEGLSDTHQQTCPQSTGITREGVDRMPGSGVFIPVFEAFFTLHPTFFAPFLPLLAMNSGLLKKQAYPTEPAPNGALATLSWAHQQRCPH